MTTSTASTTTARRAFDRGDLEAFRPVDVLVGNVSHWVAIADTEEERQLGMQGVGNVGDFTGMLFVWDAETSTGFFMKGTVMPLDLFFYSGSGDLVDQVSLVPCGEDPCPVYVSDSMFRWVLETPAGNLAPPWQPLVVPGIRSDRGHGYN